MDFEECNKYISAWYFSDTVELLDLVLNDDDDVAPKYSAITTLNRFWVYLQYQKILNNNSENSSVSSLLQRIGYSTEDIAVFRKKALKEREIYTAEILDTEFF